MVTGDAVFLNVTGDEVCEEIYKNTNDIVDVKISFLENPYMNMTPGDSDIFTVFGWDSFGNVKETDEYTIGLDDSVPVSLSGSSQFTYENKNIWVLPLFVEAGGLGDEGQGYIKDTDGCTNSIY